MSSNRYPPELRGRAVRRVPEQCGEYSSEPDAIRAIAPKRYVAGPDAPEQTLRTGRPSGTIHHSDKGPHYVSLAYPQRLNDADLLASAGSTGDPYDNASAGSISGLYRAEVIHRKRRKNRPEAELATPEWVDGFSNRRLPERTGYIPPVEAEKADYASLANKDMAA